MSQNYGKLIKIYGNEDILTDVIRMCSASGCFRLKSPDKHTWDKASPQGSNPYSTLVKRLGELDALWSIGFDKAEIDYSHFDLSNALATVTAFEGELALLQNQRREVESQIRSGAALIANLAHFVRLGTDLKRLSDCRFITMRIGVFPLDGLLKLRYYESQKYIFVEADRNQEQCWGLCFCPREAQKIIGDILDSLYFKEINLPEGVTGNASDIISCLHEEGRVLSEECARIEKSIMEHIARNAEILGKLYSQAKSYFENYEMRSYADIYKQGFILSGYARQEDSGKFIRLFENMDGVTVKEILEGNSKFRFFKRGNRKWQ